MGNRIDFGFFPLLFQKLLALCAVLAVASADVSHFYDNSNGYEYPKPPTKLCPDGSVRAICDEPQVCPPGSVGVYPNCQRPTPPPKCPPGKCILRSKRKRFNSIVSSSKFQCTCKTAAHIQKSFHFFPMFTTIVRHSKQRENQNIKNFFWSFLNYIDRLWRCLSKLCQNWLHPTGHNTTANNRTKMPSW